MGDAPGTGRVLRDLGVIDRWSEPIEGSVGGPGQPSTLLILFQVDTPFILTLQKERLQPFTDRFLSLGLRDREDTLIPLGDDGRPRMVDAQGTTIDESAARLPAGGYAISISTSQWQATPFRLRLQVATLGSLSLVLAGQGPLVAIARGMALRCAAGGRGALAAQLGRTVKLSARAGGIGQLRSGLMAVPTYEAIPGPGLPHAWVLEDGDQLRIGSGQGLRWLSFTPAKLTGFIPSTLSLTDYRAQPRRLIFAAGSDTVYGAYPDIGPTPANVTGPVSPDFPAVSFHSIIQGSYSRRITFSLPVNGSKQILVMVREELRWNNDVVRDTFNGAYTATTRASRSAHQRIVHLFVVTGDRVRVLRQAPRGFMSQLAQLLPPLNTLLISQLLQVPGELSPRARVRCTVPAFALSQSAPSEGDRILGGDPSEPYGGLLASFGLTRGMQAARGFTSAAIYDLLRNFSLIRAEPDYDRRSYSFAIRVLASRPDQLPQYMPWTSDGGYAINQQAAGGYGDSQVSRLRYGEWRGAIPADASTQVTLTGDAWRPVNLDQVLDPNRLYRGRALQAYVAYDWNQPLARRTDLGAMGFTSADLLDIDPGTTSIILIGSGETVVVAGSGSLAGSTVRAQRVRVMGMVARGQGRIASVVRLARGAILRGRGGMRGLLSLGTSARVSTLFGGARGSGRLRGGSILASPMLRIRNRGDLGRPRLSSGPP
ncbi:MAG: hypothetical protein VKI63_06105 [Cyanobium sp.]|nr:hypothetical protein [Cyanobium sp.]